MHNTILIDFEDFYNNTISINVLDALHTYKHIQESKIDLKSKEVKSIILNFVSYHVAKLINLDSIDKSILIIQPYIINKSEILNYINSVELFKSMLLKNLKALKQNFPKRIIILKEFKDLSNPDTIKLIFNKCNVY